MTTAPAPIAPRWNCGGELEDIANPEAIRLDWNWIALTLAGLPRFGKQHPGLPLSVAQHCVMGADALHRETGSSRLAAMFLLHDAHEFVLTDLTTPVVKLLAIHIGAQFPKAYRDQSRVEAGVKAAKAAIDAVIYPKAGLPGPLRWTPAETKYVRDMDMRMFEAEATALYGIDIWETWPRSTLPAPKCAGSIMPPWGAAKAEEAWLDRLQRHTGLLGARVRCAS